MDIVDEGFDGVLKFRGARWTPLGEDGAFDIGGVPLEAQFLWSVEVSVPVPSLSSPSAGPSLLLHFSFVPHGDVLALFYSNVNTTSIL